MSEETKQGMDAENFIVNVEAVFGSETQDALVPSYYELMYLDFRDRMYAASWEIFENKKMTDVLLGLFATPQPEGLLENVTRLVKAEQLSDRIGEYERRPCRRETLSKFLGVSSDKNFHGAVASFLFAATHCSFGFEEDDKTVGDVILCECSDVAKALVGCYQGENKVYKEYFDEVLAGARQNHVIQERTDALIKSLSSVREVFALSVGVALDSMDAIFQDTALEGEILSKNPTIPENHQRLKAAVKKLSNACPEIN